MMLIMDDTCIGNESSRSAKRRWEVALWVVVGLVSLMLRIAQLDAPPLTADEAAAATAAWRAVTGEGLSLTDYNPLLLAGNSLLFTLFGAGDAMARLWPALFGWLLVLTPMLWRRSLGRVGALAAGAYLALSPAGLVASRQVEGTMIAALGAIVFIGGLIRFLESDRSGWLTLAALGLALGVSSGVSAYGLLLPLGLAVAVVAKAWPEDLAWRSHDDLSRLRPHAASFLLVFGVAVLVLSTGLGWNLPGFGSVGGLFVAWLSRFRSGLRPSASPLTLLAVYELSATVFGIGGLVVGVLRGRRTAVLLGVWAALEALMLGLMPGRAPTDLVWVVIPLALLTGMGIDELVRGRWFSGGALQVAYGSIVLVLWGHCYLMLARYATFGDRTDLALALITVVLQMLLSLSFGLALGADRTVRTMAAGTGIVLVMLTVAAGWRVAYRHPTDPREPLLSEPTAVNVRDLVQTLRELSWRETGLPTTLAFTVVAPQDSVLSWYLRDFTMARHFERPSGLTSEDLGPIVVTSGRDETLVAAAQRPYAGQDFPVSRQWTPRELGCRFWRPGCHAAVDWFLFREGVPLPEADQWAALWRISELSDAE